MAHIEHAGKKYPIPDGATAQETLESLQAAGLAELNNATLEPKGDHYVAVFDAEEPSADVPATGRPRPGTALRTIKPAGFSDVVVVECVPHVVNAHGVFETCFEYAIALAKSLKKYCAIARYAFDGNHWRWGIGVYGPEGGCGSRPHKEDVAGHFPPQTTALKAIVLAMQHIWEYADRQADDGSSRSAAYRAKWQQIADAIEAEMQTMQLYLYRQPTDSLDGFDDDVPPGFSVRAVNGGVEQVLVLGGYPHRLEMYEAVDAVNKAGAIFRVPRVEECPFRQAGKVGGKKGFLCGVCCAVGCDGFSGHCPLTAGVLFTRGLV